MAKFSIITSLLILSLFLATSPSSAVATPSLQSPSSGSTTSDTSPTLSWSWSGTCFESGSCFRAEVSDNLNFSSPKYRYTSNTYYSPELSEGTWYWRVKAKDTDNNWSDWSTVWNFSITSASSPNPAPTSTQTPAPVNNSQTGGGQVLLSEFLPNPQEGNEWVEIFNPTSSAALDISGYKIDDIEGGSSPFTIPQGTTIGPQNYLYFSFSSRLNNDGDSVRLIDTSGKVLEEYSYGQSSKGISFAKDTQGAWQETTTPTPGAANIITKPQVEGTTTEGKTSQSTTKKSTSEKPASTSKPASEAKSTTSKQVGTVLSTSTEEAVLPAATVTAQEKEEETKVASSKRNLLPAILFVAAGVTLFLGIGAKIAKSKKKK